MLPRDGRTKTDVRWDMGSAPRLRSGTQNLALAPRGRIPVRARISDRESLQQCSQTSSVPQTSVINNLCQSLFGAASFNPENTIVQSDVFRYGVRAALHCTALHWTILLTSPTGDLAARRSAGQHGEAALFCFCTREIVALRAKACTVQLRLAFATCLPRNAFVVAPGNILCLLVYMLRYNLPS